MLLYFLVLAAFAQGLVSLRDGLRNARYSARYRKPPGPSGGVIVFCPVKGRDADLEANARSLLEQRHPDHRIVFLVDEAGDPAVAALESLEGGEVMVGGRSPLRGQKVHNLLCGIERFGQDAPIWVFADADARFSPEWLDELIAPLADPRIGASTGYRWYVPQPGSVASLMRSAWNASVAGFLGPHRNNFVWGGSMAIRRDVFLGAGIGKLWEHALSDDYALSFGVRRYGLEIAYVPTCLVPSYEGCTWRELLEFTTRQIRITRVYASPVWRIGFITNLIFSVTFWWLTAALFAGRLGLVAPWLVLYGLTLARSQIRLQGIRHVIHDPSLRVHRWFYRLSAPVVSLLYVFNFVMSLLSRTIRWKNVEYTMISPEETRVRFEDL